MAIDYQKFTNIQNPAESLAQGLALGSSILDARVKSQQQNRLLEFQNEISQAANNPIKFNWSGLATKYPEMAGKIKDAMSVYDAATNKTLQQDGNRLYGLLAQNRVQEAKDFLQNRVDLLEKAGADSSTYKNLLQTVQTQPQNAAAEVAVTLSSTDPEKFGKIQSNFIGAQTVNDSLNLKKAELEKSGWDIKKIQSDIFNKERDFQIKKAELGLKKAELGLKNEENSRDQAIFNQQLTKLTRENQQAIDDRVAEGSSKLGFLSDSLGLLRDIQNLGGLSKFGDALKFSALSNVPYTDAKTVSNKIEQLSSRLTLENLKNLVGSSQISNADVLIVSKAMSSLSSSTLPLEQKAKELEKVQKILERGAMNTSKKYGAPPLASPVIPGGFWNPPIDNSGNIVLSIK